MTPESLRPDDQRVDHRFKDVGGNLRYHYMLAKPANAPTATVLLLHGWPDLGMGWRFQVPYLLSLGLQVIIPDQLGYGQTSAPAAAEEYSLKKTSAHMAQIVRDVTDEPVIVGGHDWGAFLAWRLAMYHRPLVRAIFSFCIPFAPPQADVVQLAEFVEQHPEFRYQLQNAGPEAQAMGDASPSHLRGFLNTMFGGTTPEGLPGFDPWVGLISDRLLRVSQSPLMAREMMDHYVREYSRNGLRGPMNWYRTRAINGEDELPLVSEWRNYKFQMPAMLVMAGQDPALKPALAEGQEQYFDAELRKHVVPQASHWILIHYPEESNRFIGEFIHSVLHDG